MRKITGFLRAWRLVCVFALLFCCEALRAEYGDLLTQTHRPTAEEFLAKVKPWPSTNPFGSPAIGGLEGNLAETIVAMEKAYPGAIWAPLGRDAANFGAVLDAYYTAMGQPHRVAYLRASGDSIRGTGVSKSTLVKFLESAGLDLDPNSGKKQRPFVIIDRTSFGASSQLKKLMTIGYDEWVRKGGRREDLVRRFNGLIFDNAHITPQSTPENFLKAQEGYVATQGGVPKALMAISRGDNSQNGDGLAWHETFDQIVSHSDGYYADPKPPSANYSAGHRQILADMYEAISLARNPTFQKKVADLANQAGVTLSFKPSDYKPPTPAKPPQPKSASTLRSELRNLVRALPVQPHSHGISQNARDLLRWLDDEVAAVAQADRNGVILYFLDRVNQAKKDQKVGTRDIRALVANALRQADITSQFISDLCAVLKTNSRIKKVLEDDGDYFMKQDAPIKDAYRKVVKKLSETQGCQLTLKKLVAI